MFSNEIYTKKKKVREKKKFIPQKISKAYESKIPFKTFFRNLGP